MRRVRVTVLGGFVAAVLLCLSPAAFAGGFGPAFEYGHTWGEFNDQDYEGDHAAVSFLYDSNVARDLLLNYRLQVGFLYGDFDDGSESYGVGIVNTLGFGVLRTRTTRLWVGPSLRIDVSDLDVDSAFGHDPDITELEIGAGPQVGCNWHFNDRLSLTASFSYQYLWVADFCDGCGGNDYEDGGASRIAFNVGVLFHTAGDFFDAGYSPYRSRY